MADLGTLVTITEKVFQLLQSPVLQEMKDWRSELQNLNQTVRSIKNMLLDADKKPELTHEERGWLDNLREVLYDAGDLFDEVVTLSKQKKLMNEGDKLSKKITKKVSRFFSSKNGFLVGYKRSQEVKNIRRKLGDIASDHERYGFKVDSQATRLRRVDTCSFLNESDEKIIGRDNDVKAILDLLYDCNNVEDNNDNVGFIVIVGVGGLGKTALARLVFNHQSVKSKFEKNKMLWSCVSDQVGQRFDVKSILRKVLESSSMGSMPSDSSTMQSIQGKIKNELEFKKYILVLDDVWTEDPHQWGELRKYLTIGAKGSKIVVTTRSEKTAEMVLGTSGAHPNKYMLKGLLDDDAWTLFELTAFERGSQQAKNLELVEIGKNILKKCANVPLAIKVVGTLLHSLDTSKWQSFEEKRLCDIENDKNPIIMPILKLSYYNLEPSLKSCFSYCASFPKDFEMEKEMLISLWMAQGYIVPSMKRQSIEEAAEDHFGILLKRCFFQDFKKDEIDEVCSFKIHDLMHDLAQEVVGDEISIMSGSKTDNVGINVRHLFVNEGKFIKSCYSMRKIRSCYMDAEIDSNQVKMLTTNWTCIRTLCLFLPDSESLPESIGKLLHLRYLDLSCSDKLKTLPNTISKLYNLQSLVLRYCKELREWPKDFSKLVNLRHLDVRFCFELTSMPLGIEKLIELQILPHFFVTDPSSSKNPIVEQLRTLNGLTKLRGSISIKFPEENSSSAREKRVWEGGCLECIKDLKRLQVDYACEAGMEMLQPHRYMKHLELNWYKGAEIPRWGRPQDDWVVLLPNLVTIKFLLCERLQHLPSMSKLRHLKSLTLRYLSNLEYMEVESGKSIGSNEERTSFFPSLEFLEIVGASKLKGWWSPMLVDEDQQPPFHRLSDLSIEECPLLTSFPPCPSLKSASLIGNHEELRISTRCDPLPTNVASLDGDFNVDVDGLYHLKSLSHGRPISTLCLYRCKMESLGEVEETFKTFSSSLRSLSIIDCSNLKTLSRGGLEHLTSLVSLKISHCPELRFHERDDINNDMPWRSLHRNLRTLKLKVLENVEYLPRGIQYLTNLQNLTIDWCAKLKVIPGWIDCLTSLRSLEIFSCAEIESLPATIQLLTSLQSLEIMGCSNLRFTCKKWGRDWSKIKHISHISVI